MLGGGGYGMQRANYVYDFLLYTLKFAALAWGFDTHEYCCLAEV